MRYGELTREDLAGLRILAALEIAYPKDAARLKVRASTVLDGWKAWRARQGPPMAKKSRETQ